MSDRFATLMDPPVLIRTVPAVVDRVKEDLFDRFAGLAEMRTRRALPFPKSSPVCGEICGIMLDRRLPFSLRTGPMLDRRLLELLLVEARSALAFPVEGARLVGELGLWSRTLGTWRFPSLDESSDPIRLRFRSARG